jgi:predicted ATPase
MRYEIDLSKFDTIKERLDGSFMELYEQNLNDTQIAKSLNLNQNTVGNYRRKLGLENNYRKKSLLQQAKEK